MLGRIDNFIPPKRRGTKDEILIFEALDLGYEPLKSISKVCIASIVHPSKIFVWDSRRQLVPFFSTISILNMSTNASTWIRG
jgi:hypothetical protein